MKNRGTYYMTTAIAYASGKPHIGNTYEIILADAIARYKRQMGYDVFFQTGTDEHGQKIEDRARKAGMKPKEYVDQTAGEIKRIWDLMDTSYDKFIRTTDPDHEEKIQKIFRKLYDQGDIYKGYYEGMYCQECEAFYTPSQLTEDGRCPVCGGEVHEAKEEAYFFKMSKYADRLMEHIETHPEFIQPESRKNEMINNFLKPGLQDLCVSRTSFSWGIPVDFDPKHVTYVWLDALCNYITGIGYDPDRSSDLFKKYWPADLHLIGKDIIRFHTIYWPIFLMALDLPLPKQVFGHPWLLQSGGKMSKSKGNVIYADDLAEIFNVDAVRYFCIHEMPFENDGVISYDLMVERWNSELANTMGNLVNRTIAMCNQYFGGAVQNRKASDDEGIDDDFKKVIGETVGKVEEKMNQLRVADSLTEVFSLFKRCNKYIDENEPWKLAKDESKQDRLATVLYNLFDGIETGATLLSSYMPSTAKKILEQIKAPAIDYNELGHAGNYPEENKVTDQPEILFQRLKLKDVMDRVEEQKKKAGTVIARDAEPEQKKTEAAKEGEEAAVTYTHKAECTYEDFDRCEFRVGVIRACEEVKKSRKLLCSQVDLGDQTVQILSGLRPQYTPDQMVGKRVMVITNLAPRRMAGLISQGMILCAEQADGTLALMTPEKDLPAGSEIG